MPDKDTAARSLAALHYQFEPGMREIYRLLADDQAEQDPDEPINEFLAAGNFVPFTPPWNTTGQPAVSIPLHWADGLPVGIQLVGRPGREDVLIRLSAQLEEAKPWADRRPPVS